MTRTPSFALVVVVTWLGASLFADPQAPARSPVTITGRIVDNNGQPLARATVSITRDGARTATLSGDDGRFTLRPASSTVTVVASKPGYRRRTMTLATDRPWEIALARGSVISGRVLDEYGEPAVGMRVFAERVDATRSQVQAAGSATADDRGDFRIIDLDAGLYAVSIITSSTVVASTPSGGFGTFRPSSVRGYFPNRSSLTDAELQDLSAGTERSGIDFVVSAGYLNAMTMVTIGAVPPTTEPAFDVRGRVMTTEGRPLAGASVLLIPGGPVRSRPPQPMTSDRDGHFVFAGTPASIFRVVVNKAGYAVDPTSPYGGFRTVEIAAGRALPFVDVKMSRLAVVSGRVVDDGGDPLPGATVTLFRLAFERGRRQWVPGMSRLTDDRGGYRLFDVPSGQYVVGASSEGVASEDLAGFGRTFFPGTTAPTQAQYITVAMGQDVGGIDVAMLRAVTVRLSGRIVDETGQPSTGGSVQLFTSRGNTNSPIATAAGAVLHADGRFEFVNVGPGEYVIHADRGRKNASTEGEFGALPISVGDRDIADLVVRMSVGSDVSGRIRFESAERTSPSQPGPFTLTALPSNPDLVTGGSVAEANIAADGSFRMSGLHGPRRLVMTRAPRGWMVREILVNGIDVTDRPIEFGRANQSLRDVEIVVTDRVSRVTGRLVDDNSRGVPSMRVVIFSLDRARWFFGSRQMMSALTGDDGGFSVEGLPAGSYLAAAVSATLPGGPDAWQDPSVLESLASRATSLAIGEGQATAITVRLPR